MAKETTKAPAGGAKKGADDKKKTPVKKATKNNTLMFPTRTREMHLGGAILPKGRDLGRFVRWPRYIRVQRQKKILNERLKVPPAINQFRSAVKQNQANEVFKLLEKLKPETATEKRARLAAIAKGGEKTAPKPAVKMGLTHVTSLIESKKAKLVLIASDVHPIELVVWLPALCRKMEVPYMIIHNKGRLGAAVHKKTAACLAVTKVAKEDEPKLKALQDSAKALFNDNKELLRKWGGGNMGERTKRRVEAHNAAIAAERAKKAKIMG